MRIISGTFRGKKIFKPKDKNTRPLKDLAKESIFNIIAHSNNFKINLKQSTVLDLFSGVGSFGIECLSRGVKKVTFVENYKNVLSILKKNLNNLKLIENYLIIEEDIYNDRLFLKLKNKFDIIFMDPPFKDKNLDAILLNIKEKNILNKNGLIIIHRHKSEKDFLIKHFKIISEKKYGISKIIFLIHLN